MSVHLQARRRDGGQGWDTALTFAARTRESGFRTAARKLGLRGPILSVERVGSSEWAVNVDGQMMMVAVNGHEAHIVIGHGQARRWSDHASAVERGDVDLLTTAHALNLFGRAQEAGYATREGELLDDAWLLVVGDAADEAALDSDPSVIAYCRVQS